MIPRKVHYCWFGKGPKGDLAEMCMKSWRRHLPGYELIEWNEGNADLSSDYAQEALRQKRWSKVANLVRLQALLDQGGVYFDTDVEVVKPIDPLLNAQCFAGFQMLEESNEWVNNAVLGGVPGHQFFRDCIQSTLSHYALKGEFALSPYITTLVLKSYGLCQYGAQELSGVTLHQRDVFYPYSWLEQYRPEVVTKDTFCVHHWEKSWVRSPWSPDVLMERFKRALQRIAGAKS